MIPPLKHFILHEFFQLLNILNGLIEKDKFRPVSVWYETFSVILCLTISELLVALVVSLIAKAQVCGISRRL